MIEVSGLSARAGEFALRDISFSVPAGGYGVVIGPAGAGKTTLLEALAGIRPATAGSVRLGDTDVTTKAPEERGIGFVYQHGFLFPHLSVWANIRYGARDDVEAKDLARRNWRTGRCVRCREANDSSSRSRGRSRRIRASCSWTSRSTRSTRGVGRR